MHALQRRPHGQDVTRQDRHKLQPSGGGGAEPEGGSCGGTRVVVAGVACWRRLSRRDARTANPCRCSRSPTDTRMGSPLSRCGPTPAAWRRRRMDRSPAGRPRGGPAERGCRAPHRRALRAERGGDRRGFRGASAGALKSAPRRIRPVLAQALASPRSGGRPRQAGERLRSRPARPAPPSAARSTARSATRSGRDRPQVQAGRLDRRRDDNGELRTDRVGRDHIQAAVLIGVAQRDEDGEGVP